MGAGAKSLFQVFSAYAEVVLLILDSSIFFSRILRVRGGSSVCPGGQCCYSLYSPRTRR